MRYIITELTKIHWTTAKDIFRNENVWIPSHLIYLMSNQKTGAAIRFSDSTGAAAGTSIEEALYHGLCEVIERDAFVITYYNQLPVTEINLNITAPSRTQRLIKYIRKFIFEIKVYDITSDIKIPTFLALLMDKSGSEPRFSIGTKTDLNWQNAVHGSILESLQGLYMLRTLSFYKHDRSTINRFYNDPTIRRLLFWLDKDPKKYLTFLFRSVKKERKFNNILLSQNIKSKLNILLDILKSQKLNIYWKDLTSPNLKKFNLFSVKVIIDSLQPMSLHSDYPYLGGERIRTVPLKLGYRNMESKEENLQVLPHPLP